MTERFWNTTKLAGLGPLVTTHWFTPCPISLDNKARPDYWDTGYLAPNGEKGKWAESQGAVRDRPIPRAPIAGDWRRADAVQSVRDMAGVGIDAAAIEIIKTTPGDPLHDRAAMLIDVMPGTAPDFRAILTPDMNVSAFKTTTEEALVAALIHFAFNEDGTLRPQMQLRDGKLLVNPFKSENRTPQYWANVRTKFKKATGLDVFLWLTFLNWRASAPKYAAVADGIAGWGEASLTRNPSATAVAQQITDGKKLRPFMAWSHPFDHRPSVEHGPYFDEPIGTVVMENQYRGALAGKAEALQVVTWNDFFETPNGPSVGHGHALAELHAFFIAWLKTGKAPSTKRDAVFLTHRNQLAQARPRRPSPQPMTVRDNTNAAVNIAEALVFLTEPGTLTLGSGKNRKVRDAPAGMSRHTIALAPGDVTATVVRKGQTVVDHRSPFAVASIPEVQDMQYHVSSSLEAA